MDLFEKVKTFLAPKKEEITELGLDKDQILFNENNIGY